ncbi:TIGR00153 family protein [Chlamydia sp.]|uniref:TIGR00153 family protein n=1 Tax=Chlamydia sp. TaxID=35827 RepID=UPI0025B81899|nr:TIGR00153 family protein [Chlamydia sp.]MBQ8498813.1 TIGR00153 family protein [Chlamydia sp.]
MQVLASLFGQSPFAPLQAHIELVSSSVSILLPLFSALREGDYERVEALAKLISSKERQADGMKNDVRKHLTSGVFIPVPRLAMLEIISIQDSLADNAEDVAILLTVKELRFYPEFEELFFEFLQKTLESFEAVAKTIREIDRLLESSFGGSRAEKTRTLVSEVSNLEHECDVLQKELMKIFFSEEFAIGTKDFVLWMQIIKRVAGISNNSEKLAYRVSMTLEEK